MGRPRVIRNFSKSVDVNQGKLCGSKTAYGSTYIEHRDFKPPKTLKPPPTPVKPRYPAMQTETTTMKSFVAKDMAAKREMIIPVEKHEVSEEPFSNVTEYRNEFPAKPVLPSIQMRPKTDTEPESRQVKFDSRTTNKHAYQDWKPEARKRYGEFPAFTAPLIYPGKRAMRDDKDLFQSRSHADFSYKTIPKPQMVKAAEPNIKVGEGDRNLQTTHRSTYNFKVGQGQAAVSMRPSKNARSAGTRAMELTSKYQADFPKMGKYPAPPKPATPAPDTLEIKMIKNMPFVTEQRQQYHGWDVKKFPRPDASKLQDNTELSQEPMQTKSTTNFDYVPKEISLVRPSPADRPHSNSPEFVGKFRGVTTNKSAYKDWAPKARQRFGDFHEACKQIYIPQLRAAQDFSTTTKSTFIEKHGRPRTCMKPATDTIDTSQQQDFNTVSNMCYQYPPQSAYEIEDFVVRC